MRIVVRSLISSGVLRSVGLILCFVALAGCAAMKRAPEAVAPIVPPVAIPLRLVEKVERHEFSVARGEDVIGLHYVVRLEPGDTLPDIGRHFGLGLNALTAANPGVDIWVPEAGTRVNLPLQFILPDAPRKGIVINLAAMRLFQFSGTSELQKLVTYPVGVGTEERPSPRGQMRVERKVARPTWYVPPRIAKDRLKKGDLLPAAVPPGPQNPLGEHALYLSAATYLIHGTNKPASIGLKATNGCIRLFPEDVKRLFESTPVKTAVNIVNQPYLLGQRKGVLYLEVHGEGEELDTVELDRVYARLKAFEKAAGRPVDWNKVKTALAEARGVPVPIFEVTAGSMTLIAPPLEVRHPVELTGRPVVPELQPDAWAVVAADLADRNDAQRLAAIITHQGPSIPARVVPKDASYYVVAGPFADSKEAKEAIKRLKIDLEIDGTLIEPVKRN